MILLKNSAKLENVSSKREKFIDASFCNYESVFYFIIIYYELEFCDAVMARGRIDDVLFAYFSLFFRLVICGRNGPFWAERNGRIYLFLWFQLADQIDVVIGQHTICYTVCQGSKPRGRWD